MIILDLNQVMISNMMAQIGGKNVDVQEDLLRHMILNSIRSLRSKFHDEYGELTIAVDDRSYWRRDVFPYYKAQRKNWREQSGLDWPTIFESLNKIRDELRDNFPYKYIMVDGAEADDIIGTICDEHGQIMNTGEPILILSGDKDFIQLQKYGNVRQYCPVRKKFLKTDNPERFLTEHILRGDKSDGVPNVLSLDDCFINGRQRPLRKTVIEKCIAEGPEAFDEDFVRNYKRNEQLVDLAHVPSNIRINILEQFNTETRDRSGLFNYFIDKRLKGLMDNIGDF
tara:strand:- start:6462 stop:7310 length:849 start_codon:yes stop_codon:yes gene_type:complete